jgi:enoyl-CoA hydratase/carnithine racemase
MYSYEKTYDHVVTYEKENHIATITLDCPQNNNRINEQQIDELTQALDTANWDDEVRVVILRGTGDWSFGPGDITVIKEKLAKNLTEGRKIMHVISDMIKKMYTISKPIIGIADAGCIGGGCNLLLSSDIVIASEKAYFLEIFADYALSPDTGGLWALQRLVGPMKAKALAMTAEPVGAQAALAMGMVYKVVPADKTYEEAVALATKIASKSPVGINHIKQISNRLHDYSMDTYFQIEADYLCMGSLSEDFKETNIAIAQKRAPEYKGY